MCIRDRHQRTTSTAVISLSNNNVAIGVSFLLPKLFVTDRNVTGITNATEKAKWVAGSRVRCLFMVGGNPETRCGALLKVTRTFGQHSWPSSGKSITKVLVTSNKALHLASGFPPTTNRDTSPLFQTIYVTKRYFSLAFRLSKKHKLFTNLSNIFQKEETIFSESAYKPPNAILFQSSILFIHVGL